MSPCCVVDAGVRGAPLRRPARACGAVRVDAWRRRSGSTRYRQRCGARDAAAFGAEARSHRSGRALEGRTVSSGRSDHAPGREGRRRRRPVCGRSRSEIRRNAGPAPHSPVRRCAGTRSRVPELRMPFCRTTRIPFLARASGERLQQISSHPDRARSRLCACSIKSFALSSVTSQNSVNKMVPAQPPGPS